MNGDRKTAGRQIFRSQALLIGLYEYFPTNFIACMNVHSYVYRYTQGMQLNNMQRFYFYAHSRDKKSNHHSHIGKCCDQTQSAPRGKFCTYIIARQREELISLQSQYVCFKSAYICMYVQYIRVRMYILYTLTHRPKPEILSEGPSKYCMYMQQRH